jgi:hypothetical protein
MTRERFSRSASHGKTLPLWMGLPPHSNHDSSLDAAVEIREHLARLQGRVLEAVRASGSHGTTDQELEQATGLGGSTVRPRRLELYNRGLVVWNGYYRITKSGRRSRVWIATNREV